jgi:hypothetical protein
MRIALFSDVHANQQALDAVWEDIKTVQRLCSRVSPAQPIVIYWSSDTHLPYTKQVGDTLFVNTGSVDKPKLGDPRAGYVMLTLETDTTNVEFRRVD